MKKLLAGAAVAAMALAAGSAYATDYSQTVAASGIVAAACAADEGNTNTLTLAIPTLADATTGLPIEAANTVTVSSKVKCTTPAFVSVKKVGGYLKQASATCSAGSAECVRYTATATINSVAATVASTASAAGSKASALAGTFATATNLDLTVTPANDAIALAAGTFSDTITVQVGSPM